MPVLALWPYDSYLVFKSHSMSQFVSGDHPVFIVVFYKTTDQKSFIFGLESPQWT